ncbi:hypothetical protein LWI28_000883 [Acer negundo]|uniref:Bidirectional sugar transporter SWEET n=1 Tax=Acer negundo TaxID=4023 RepID=A0AAD5NR34_ACENE|nr:hypothetical protein LWI28_000883 [Acer negundo]
MGLRVIRSRCFCSTFKYFEVGNTHQECGVYAILSIVDYYVAVPNILGFIFGILQMILYVVYKNYKPIVADDKLAGHDVKLSEISVDIQNLDDENGTKTVHDKTHEDDHDKDIRENPLSKC